MALAAAQLIPSRSRGAVVLGLICVLCGWTVPAHAFLPPPYGGAMVAPLADAPLTLDPTKASRESELHLVTLLYDTLYRMPDPGKFEPHLVRADPVVSGDGLSWVFKVKSGVRLHDGSRLVAADIVSALQRLKTSSQGYVVDVLASVSSPSADTVRITLKRSAPLPRLLSSSATAIIAKRRAGYVGSGPFRLVSRRVRGLRREITSVQLEAHGDYFKGRPYLDRLTFRSYAKASVHTAAFQVGRTQISLQGQAVFGGRPKHAANKIRADSARTLYLLCGPRANTHLCVSVAQRIDRNRLARAQGSAVAALALGAAATHSPKPLVRATLPPSRRQSGTLLIDGSRFEERRAADTLIADLDRQGIALRSDVQPAPAYQRKLMARDYQLVLHGVPHSHPELALHHAAVLAIMAQRQRAASCAGSRDGCLAQLRWLAQQDVVFPLIRVSTQVHYDARLGGVTEARPGYVDFARIYWRRPRP